MAVPAELEKTKMIVFLVKIVRKLLQKANFRG